MLYLQLAMAWLLPLMLTMALIASVRHISLAKNSPVLAGWFAMVLAVNVLSRLLNPFIYSSSSHSIPIPPLAFTYMPVVWMLLSLCGWGMVAFGLYAVLEEVSRKLALLQLAPQNAWNYQAAPNAFQAQTTANPQVQSPFVQTQSLQNPLSQQGQEQIREEAHASANVSPAAPAPAVADNRPVLSVQPDAPLTLGSSR